MKHTKIGNSLGCHESAVTTRLYPRLLGCCDTPFSATSPAVRPSGSQRWAHCTAVWVRPRTSPHIRGAATARAMLWLVVSTASLPVRVFRLTPELLEAPVSSARSL